MWGLIVGADSTLDMPEKTQGKRASRKGGIAALLKRRGVETEAPAAEAPAAEAPAPKAPAPTAEAPNPMPQVAAMIEDMMNKMMAANKMVLDRVATLEAALTAPEEAPAAEEAEEAAVEPGEDAEAVPM